MRNKTVKRVQTTVNERLKILFEALGVKPSQAARILGISASTMNNYLDRGSKPGYDVLEKLYFSFENLNLAWLFGSGGEPLLPIATEPHPSYTIQKKNTGNVVGTNHGSISQQQSNAECEKELAAARQTISLLSSQLLDKDKIIKLYELQLPFPPPK